MCNISRPNPSHLCNNMCKLKKTLFILTGSIILFVAFVILFISPIAKYLIEMYDEKYTGRQITMDWAYVNPFSGYIHFNDLKIYEMKSDNLFFSANSVSANIVISKLFSKTFEISEITLDHPYGIVIKNKKELNFSNLIERYSSKDETKTKSTILFNIFNIKIIDGEIHYKEDSTAVNYYVKGVNIESEGKKWDADTIAAKVSFLSGIGTGDINGNITVNFKNLDYHFNAIAHKFDLKIIEQYLSELINYGSFKANIDANLKASGNFHDKEKIDAKGLLVINDFHFGKNQLDDYTSFEKFTLFINELNPKKHIYLIDSASLQHPYFKYERYDNNSDNIQTMFGKKGANVLAANANPEKFNLIIEIAKYVKVLAKNFFKSNYKINRLAIYNGDFKYNDYTLNEIFSTDIAPLYAFADSINKNTQWVKATFKSGIKPYGNANVILRINPKDSSDFDVNYHISKLPASLLNPFLIAYTSFPLDRGTIDLKGSWNVRSDIINSNNHLIIIDPRLTERIIKNDTKWIPMRLIMSLIRERGNVIDYEIPITGNLKNPKFNLKDVLFDVLENTFVKPPTTPYRMEVKNVETEIEKSLTLKWQMRSASLLNGQEQFIKKICKFLADNPSASIFVHPERYSIKEKEYILLFEAKKKYFLSINANNVKSFSEDDSLEVNEMSIKDSLFVRYLNRQVNDSLAFTIQSKCAKIIDSAYVNKKFKQLNSEREKVFISYFEKKKIKKQVKFSTPENTIPYNGFSFYKIEYKREFPEFLMKAYRQMHELNDLAPRKRFKKERKENKNII